MKCIENIFLFNIFFWIEPKNICVFFCASVHLTMNLGKLFQAEIQRLTNICKYISQAVEC